MPNFSPTVWEPSGTGELGTGCDISALSGSGITIPRSLGLRRRRILLRWKIPRQKRVLGIQTTLFPTRIQYFGPEGPSTFGKYARALRRCRVGEKRNTDPRNGRKSTQITSSNCPGFTPDAASKLRGRLGFYTSLLMGRLCRGMTGPLIRRQYGPYAHLLTPDLKRNLLWRYNAIGALPPRSIPLTLFFPMGTHSDDQGHGHIATRAILPVDVSISTHLPKWFIEMAFAADSGSPIYLFERAVTALTAC